MSNGFFHSDRTDHKEQLNLIEYYFWVQMCRRSNQELLDFFFFVNFAACCKSLFCWKSSLDKIQNLNQSMKPFCIMRILTFTD